MWYYDENPIETATAAKEAADAEAAEEEEERSIWSTFAEIIFGADSFLSTGESSSKGDNEKIYGDNLSDISNLIYNTLLLIAIGAAVIVGLIMGIKFITGSIEEQAKIKESIIPYIIGCVIVFAGFTIWKILVNILQDVT